ncbi:MAG: hypothetical protein SVZ03_08695 [Spirochaetota bacterium]|nr:hypothetical protein [Spirochaetota bacterium]
MEGRYKTKSLYHCVRIKTYYPTTHTTSTPGQGGWLTCCSEWRLPGCIAPLQDDRVERSGCKEDKGEKHGY